MASFEMTNGKYDVLSTINVTRFNRVKSGEDRGSCHDRITEFMWSRSMATFTSNGYLDDGNFSKESTFTNPYVTFIEVWDVMVTIHLVNVLEASLLNHGFGTTRSFFCRLEEESNELVRWYLFAVIVDNLSHTQDSDHVTIMTTHVSI